MFSKRSSLLLSLLFFTNTASPAAPSPKPLTALANPTPTPTLHPTWTPAALDRIVDVNPYKPEYSKLASEAASSDDIEALRNYLDAGVDVNAVVNGWPLLVTAAKKGRMRTLMLLLAMGADIDAQNYSDESALSIAADNGHLEVVKILLANHAQVNTHESALGLTALHQAVFENHSAIVHELIKAGALLDLCYKDNETALHMAIPFKHTRIIKMLIAAGAKTDLKNDNGKTALEFTSDPELRILLEQWCQTQQVASRRTTKRTA